MSATFQPGNVAVATVAGAPGRRVMRTDDRTYPWRATSGAYREDDVTDARQLLVLDPAGFDAATLLRLAASLLDDGRSGYEREAQQMRGLADQVEAQTRIPEPRGRWAVVEATGQYGRFEAVRWGADSMQRPWLDASGTWLDWDDLVDPVEIRAGIEGGA